VWAAGRPIVLCSDDLAPSSIIRRDLYMHRFADEEAITAGDEVVVTLDCSAHTLRLQSPTVDHIVHIQREHQQQQQWVLNVNFARDCFEVKLL